MLADELGLVGDDRLVLLLQALDVVVQGLALAKAGDDREARGVHARTHKEVQVIVARFLVDHDLAKSRKQTLENDASVNFGEGQRLGVDPTTC